VARLVSSYVDARKVANMVVALGRGQAEPEVIAAGVDSFDGTRKPPTPTAFTGSTR
jgi:hypothetical protein